MRLSPIFAGSQAMKNWSSAIFPLTILLALTALTFWLRYATELLLTAS